MKKNNFKSQLRLYEVLQKKM